MRKYNNRKAIPVESLKKEELKEAVHEWAEGSEGLEKLIWSCINLEMETSGSNYKTRGSYLEMWTDKYTEEKKELLYRLLYTNIKYPDSDLALAPDGGNPYSGPNWSRPYITFGFNTNSLEESNERFEELDASLSSKDSIPEAYRLLFDELMQIQEFLTGKESRLNVSFAHTQNDVYELNMEIRKRDENKNRKEEIINKTGIKFEKQETDAPYDSYVLRGKRVADLLENIIKLRETISTEWDIELRNEISPTDSFFDRVLIKKRQFGDSEEGRKKLNLWLQSFLEVSNIYHKKKLEPKGMYEISEILFKQKLAKENKRNFGHSDYE